MYATAVLRLLLLQWFLGSACGDSEPQGGPRQRRMAWRRSVAPDVVEVAEPSFVQGGEVTAVEHGNLQQQLGTLQGAPGETASEKHDLDNSCVSLPFHTHREIEASIQEKLHDRSREVRKELQEWANKGAHDGCSSPHQAVKDEWLKVLFDVLARGGSTITSDMWLKEVWDPHPRALWRTLDTGMAGAISKDALVREWPRVVNTLMKKQNITKLSVSGKYMMQVAVFEVILFNALKGSAATADTHLQIQRTSGVSFERLGEHTDIRRMFVQSGKHECFEFLYYRYLHGYQGMRQSSMHEYLFNYAGSFCNDMDANHKLLARNKDSSKRTAQRSGAREASPLLALLLCSLSLLLIGALPRLG